MKMCIFIDTMKKNVLPYHLFRLIAGILLTVPLQVLGQDTISWQKIPVPSYGNFKQIQFINDSTALASGNDLALYKQNKWQLFDPQPPCHISKMFALTANAIFVSEITSDQNSNLYFWNGQQWSKIYNPTINNINDLSFSDTKNGYIVSYGEIVQLKDGKWQHITTPTNHSLSQIAQLNHQIFILAPGIGIYQLLDNKWKLIPDSQNVRLIIALQHKLYSLTSQSLGVLDQNRIKILSKNEIWQHINHFTFVRDKQIIAVGNKGIMAKLYHQKIKKITSPTESNLNQIINYKGQLWAVGDNGIILKYTNSNNSIKSTIWKGFNKISFNRKAKMIDDEYGVIAADFNNDGKTDIFTNGLFEEEHLYINHGNNSFIDKANEFGLQSAQKVSRRLNLGACAADFDNDGDMDLYVGLLNQKNIYYQNINGKYFIDYSKFSGNTGQPNDRTNACIAGDVDNDGDLDLFIINEYTTNRLFLNNGAGVFKEATLTSGLQTKEGGNAASFADIDNDGDIDLFVTNWSKPNLLYQNMYKETGKVFFKDISQSSQTQGESYTKSNAVVFADINNDGYLDIFVGNRKTSNKLYINNQNRTFTDVTKKTIGIDSLETYSVLIHDFDGDGYKDIYTSNVGENVFYKNEKGIFFKQTHKYGASQAGYSTGSALADFDNDGDMDFYSANYIGDGSSLFINKGHPKNVIKLRLKGFKNNPNAVGSKIMAFADKSMSKLLYYNEITSGSGYVSQNSYKQIIPTKKYDSIYLKIIFPNGIQKNQWVSSGEDLIINDVSKTQQTPAKIRRYLIKQFLDPHHLFELIKWVFILAFVFGFIYFDYKKHHWQLIHFFVFFSVMTFIYFVQVQEFEYENFLLSTILPLSSVLFLSLLIHYYYERKYEKSKAAIEKKHIKTKLSADLHDDLAATVSSIGFYLALIKFDIDQSNKKLTEFIGKAEQLVKDAAERISDMIWSYNAKAESLKSILLRLQENFKPLFNAQNIDFKIEWHLPQSNEKLAENIKQNIYLTLKEALHNILKYAQADKVVINIDKKNKNLVITVADNGIGFDKNKMLNKGNGLKNMQNRLKEIGGNLYIYSDKNKGTKIQFEIPIRQQK